MDRVSVIRLGCFLTVLLLIGAWEVLTPRRPLTTAKPARWFNHLGLVVLDSIAVLLVPPMGLAGMALLAAERRGGCSTPPSTYPGLAVVLSGVALLHDDVKP
jgi:hypothetical protein